MTETGNIIAAFSEEDVERLTRISKRQLRYWDSTGFFRPSLGEENRHLAHSRIYTFRDVVCLKILNTIRNESRVPLQHLREVRERLLHLGDDMWAKITLYILGRRVVFHNPETDRNEDAVSGQGILQIPLQLVSGDMQQAVRTLRERDATTIGCITRHRGRCVALVMGDRRAWEPWRREDHQCLRSARFERDGRLVCGHHLKSSDVEYVDAISEQVASQTFCRGRA